MPVASHGGLVHVRSRSPQPCRLHVPLSQGWNLRQQLVLQVHEFWAGLGWAEGPH